MIQTGDIVCTTYSIDPENPNWLQWLLSFGIRQVQCFNDVDGKAFYTHTFFMVDSTTTFEALWTYKNQNLYERYSGQQILVGRPKDLNKSDFYLAYYYLYKKYAGRRYPALKLPLFLLCPRLVKYLPSKPVCSELTAKMLCKTGIMDHCNGVTPSYIADMIRNWGAFDIIYEGECNGLLNRK
jgi:hypothetical protein